MMLTLLVQNYDLQLPLDVMCSVFFRCYIKRGYYISETNISPICAVPELGGLSRRAGCSSAFSAPAATSHHEPGKIITQFATTKHRSAMNRFDHGLQLCAMRKGTDLSLL